MKKILSMMIVSVFILALVSCEYSNKKSEENKLSNNTTSIEEQASDTKNDYIKKVDDVLSWVYDYPVIPNKIKDLGENEVLISNLKKLISGGYEVYDLFYGDVYKLNEISDYNIQDEYIKFKYKNLKTLDDVKNFTEEYYTKDFATKTFYDNKNNPINLRFKVIDNELYIYNGMSSREVIYAWFIETAQITEINENETIIKSKGNLIKEYNKIVLSEVEDNEIKLKKENGYWKLDCSPLHGVN